VSPASNPRTALHIFTGVPFSKSLSSRTETQVVAVSFKDGNDQLSNIDQKLQADSSELEN